MNTDRRTPQHRPALSFAMLTLCVFLLGGSRELVMAQDATPAPSPSRSSNLFERERTPLLLGVNVGFDFGSHSGSIVLVDTGSVPARYTATQGNSTGVHGGAVAFVGLTDFLYLSPRLQLEGRGTVFSTGTEDKTITAEDGKLYNATLERQADISMRCADIDLMLAPILFRKPMIYVCGGLSLAFPMQHSYYSYEQIVSPTNINYPGGQNNRDMKSGDVSDLGTLRSMFVSARFGVGTLVALRKYVLLVECLATVPTQPLTTDATSNWKSSTVEIHLGLLKPM